MDYNQFLDQVISDGIQAVKADYGIKDNRYNGSIRGFEDCRGKTPPELAELLQSARDKAYVEFITSTEKAQSFIANQNVGKAGGIHEDLVNTYWYYQSRALEIEWVCNTVSAMLINQGMDPIILPTCGGVLNATRILKESPSQ